MPGGDPFRRRCSPHLNYVSERGRLVRKQAHVRKQHCCWWVLFFLTNSNLPSLTVHLRSKSSQRSSRDDCPHSHTQHTRRVFTQSHRSQASSPIPHFASHEVSSIVLASQRRPSQQATLTYRHSQGQVHVCLSFSFSISIVITYIHTDKAEAGCLQSRGPPLHSFKVVCGQISPSRFTGEGNQRLYRHNVGIVCTVRLGNPKTLHHHRHVEPDRTTHG